MRPTLASEASRCAFIQSLTHRLMQTLAPADAKACIAIRKHSHRPMQAFAC